MFMRLAFLLALSSTLAVPVISAALDDAEDGVPDRNSKITELFDRVQKTSKALRGIKTAIGSTLQSASTPQSLSAPEPQALYKTPSASQIMDQVVGAKAPLSGKTDEEAKAQAAKVVETLLNAKRSEEDKKKSDSDKKKDNKKKSDSDKKKDNKKKSDSDKKSDSSSSSADGGGGDKQSKTEKDYAKVTAQMATMTNLAEFVGVALEPTEATVQNIKDSITNAKALVKTTQAEAPIEGCKNCGKYYRQDFAINELPAARDMVTEAQRRLDNAQQWAAMEQQRTASLPSLLQKMKKQAALEKQLRVAEEKRALKTAIKRAEFLNNELQKIQPMAQAVARQRLVDRIRAAEDARVADLAVKAAAKAHSDKLKEIGAVTLAPCFKAPPCIGCEYES